MDHISANLAFGRRGKNIWGYKKLQGGNSPLIINYLSNISEISLVLQNIIKYIDTLFRERKGIRTTGSNCIHI